MKYKELTVWQKSMDLVDEVYRVGRSFPPEERYGLWSQMTRSAVSVPSNIAEGSGRTTPAEFVHFLSIARGSLYELSTQLDIAVRQGYCTEDRNLSELVGQIAKMLTKMLSK